MIELEIACKVRLRIPLTTSPMIPVPSQVQIWLAVGRTECVAGCKASLCRFRRRWAGIRMPATFMSSAAAAAI